jgi:hypothetical protein
MKTEHKYSLRVLTQRFAALQMQQNIAAASAYAF